MIARDTPVARILVADTDPVAAERIADIVVRRGLDVETVHSLGDALQVIGRGRIDVVVADDRLAGGGAVELMHIAGKRSSHTAFVVTTARPEIARAVEAIQTGAHDYLAQPVCRTRFEACLDRVIAQQSLLRPRHSREGEHAQEERKLVGVVGGDYRMIRVLELVESVATTNVTVLLQGASGTGKSMIARALHDRSARRREPFVEVSCGALPETLLESELFGHVRGAFTGAIAAKAGKFKAADGGTIFLDEISAASPALQVKLLRVLQSQQFEPVGSNKTQTVNARVVLATNLDLEAQMRAGRFREDLFYRVNVVTIDLPPLADRAEDIPLLARTFLKRAAGAHGRRVHSIGDEAIRALCRYDWPGNVRELENVIERAVVLCKGCRITLDDLPGKLRSERSATRSSERDRPLPLKDALAEPERRILQAALEANGWNRQATADQLRINRTTLYKKMRRHGLDRGPFN